MSGAAVGVAAAAAAGPAGVLPSKSRAPARVLQRPGQTGRALLCKDPHLQGAPALKVSLLRWNFTSVCSASVRFFSMIAGQRADKWQKQKRKEWSNRSEARDKGRRNDLKWSRGQESLWPQAAVFLPTRSDTHTPIPQQPLRWLPLWL